MYREALQSLIQNQWNHQQPKWFITIQWSPAPYDYNTASHHAKHFRNRFLTAIYNCSLKKLPPPQERCRLIWFHERVPDSSGRLIYHSHLHLGDCPLPITSTLDLHWIIDTKVAPRFKCLKNIHRKKDPGVVISTWNHDRHAHYNLKDYYTYQHIQDADLVLDYRISDLITTK
jgi:hypothetical protein